MDEVRFDRMVPAMVVARRQTCDLAYLPIGVLEWHGSHLPFGTDFLTVTYIAEETAKRFGGVVFPPLYYGDVRYYLHDSRVEWRKTYAKSMGISEEFASAFPYQNRNGSPGEECPTPPEDGQPAAEALAFSLEDQAREFVRLVAKTLLAIHLYGFRNIVLLPGHGPLPQYCGKAQAVYEANVRRRKAFGEPARTMSFFYIEPAKELEPMLRNHWIHADKWEGSIMMVAAPETVHPEYLPKDRQTIPPAFLGHPYLTEDGGYNPQMKDLWHSFDYFDPRNADEDYGRKQMEFILKRLGEEIERFMGGKSG